MNLGSIRALVAATAVASLVCGGVATGKSKPRTVTSTVVGGWFNDAACVPTGGAPTADPDIYTFVCEGTSTWDGHFTGKTVIHAKGTTNVKTGVTRGAYSETFYGTYVPDLRTGTLTSTGSFVLADLNFVARGEITGGTCGFAGSRGVLAFDGHLAHGGYTGRWTRPASAAAAPCVTAAAS